MQPGEVLSGRYELVEVVGRGGMGEVFRAVDRRLGRVVAIKVLPRHLLGDEAATRRFRREAQLAASMDHPDTVTVHDVVKEPDVEAIVMEFVPGRTLADLLHDEGPLPWDEALALAARVGDALHAAHQRGLVHRDVKPSNVLLGDGDVVKVTDFGIARAIHSHHTVTGTVYGSVPYLSPEQAVGDPTDARSDVYGLGCLVYELVTGRPPYIGDDAVGTVYQHLHAQPVPPSERDPDLPRVVDDVVLPALERDPSRRYTSAASFAEALRDAVAGRAPTRPLPPPVGSGHGQPPVGETSTRPVRGGRVRRTPVRKSQPRRSFVPLLVALILLIFLTLWATGTFDDSTADAARPNEAAEKSPAPEALSTPSAPPSPSPSPSPTASTLADPAEESRDVRAAIAAARQDGDLSAKAEQELDKLLTTAMQKHEDGDEEAALKELDELMKKLDEFVEKGEATVAARTHIEPELEELRRAIRSD